MATNGGVGEAGKNITPQCMLPGGCLGKTRAVKCWKWDVDQLIMNKVLGNIEYGVLILNRPITQNPGFIKRLWNKASVRMTVDGGTKQWDKFLSNFSDETKTTIQDPDLITGDFDSITDEILEKYKQKGCKIIHTPDQNYTDFTKALLELNIHSNMVGVQLTHVIAIAQTSGRLDQILGNIQTLFLVRDKFLVGPNTNVFLMSDDCISWLLHPGDHVIYIPEESRQHKRAWCSLVPVGETCQRVTSTGLKWNLDNQPLRFGGIVSTSNTFDGSQKVTVKCSHTLLWSMRVPSIST
ncbi:thiamin pyrophosphokinase 1 isoform X2 [Helicoverpa zea]|uniref:thiamin pyrophosphokinase 1 isoform X2 n=1 Tax=Helicoverpa zea TaxID=7113 RepID=UPI001F5A7200|nr:thiamin pyrophosphokinase 1 isoform X2 [Helicoverpa zea]